MNKQLKILAARFSAAKADADAANRDVRQASARKLTELLNSRDPAQQLKGLRDLALTPYDRMRLEQNIADLLPSRRFKIPSSLIGALQTIFRELRYRWRRLTKIGALSAPIACFWLLAFSHTGHAYGRFNNNYDLSWRFPDGHFETIHVAAGEVAVVTGQLPNGDIRLRYWLPASGYGEAVISTDALSRITQY